MKRIASGSKDGTIRIWSTDTWECERVSKGHQGLIKALACDGNYLYSGSADNTLRIWMADTLEPVMVLQAPGKMRRQGDWWCGVTQIAVDDSRIYAGQGNGIAIYSSHDFSLERVLDEDRPSYLKLIVDDRYIYSLDLCRFKIREKDTFRVVYDVELDFDLWTIEVDEEHVYTGSHVWAIPEKKHVDTWVFEEIHAVALDDRYVYVGREGYPNHKPSIVVRERDGKLWNVVANIPNNHSESLVVDDNFIYSGEFYDRSVKVISKDTWHVEHVLSGHESPVYSVALLQEKPATRSICPKLSATPSLLS